MKNPLVSVIIPLYNAEKYISETINSVISQSYNNWEIIIVNDGSTDNSLCIAQSFESEKIKIISVNNGGASRARNIGFENSNGEFIQYLDSDDFISHDKFQNQVILLEKYNASLVFCNTYRFDEAFSTRSVEYSRINDISSDTIQLAIEIFLDNLFLNDGVKMIAVHSFLVRRSLILSAGKWNENITLDDDGEFFFRLYLKNDKIIYDSLSISFYRLSQNDSLSNISLTKGIKSEFISIESKKYHLLNSVKISEFLKLSVIRNLQSIFVYKYNLFRNSLEFQIINLDLNSNFNGFNNSLWPRYITKLIAKITSATLIFNLRLLINQLKSLKM